MLNVFKAKLSEALFGLLIDLRCWLNTDLLKSLFIYNSAGCSSFTSSKVLPTCESDLFTFELDLFSVSDWIIFTLSFTYSSSLICIGVPFRGPSDYKWNLELLFGDKFKLRNNFRWLFFSVSINLIVGLLFLFYNSFNLLL